MGNVSDGRFEGWTASVYATYIAGPVLHRRAGQGRLPHAARDGLPGSNDWTSWGGQVESGYRFPLGGSVTLEPVGTLAYVSTDVGDANVAGTIFHYGTEDSFRGAMGLRFSAPLMSNDSYMVKLAVDGRVWDEFDGDEQGHADLGRNPGRGARTTSPARSGKWAGPWTSTHTTATRRGS